MNEKINYKHQNSWLNTVKLIDAQHESWSSKKEEKKDLKWSKRTNATKSYKRLFIDFYYEFSLH